MKRVWILGCAFALSSVLAFGQEVQRTERTETRSDGVTKTETVTVTSYENRLRTIYEQIGLPEDLRARLIRIDIEIYNARVRGDIERVRQLIAERNALLSPTQLEQVRVYFREHPYVVRTGDVSFHAWDEVNTLGGGSTSVRGSVDVNRATTSDGRSGSVEVRSGTTGNRETTVRGGSAAGTASGGVTGSSSGSTGTSTDATGASARSGSNTVPSNRSSSSDPNQSRTGTTGSTGSGSTGATGSGSTGANTSGSGSAGSTGSTSGSTGGYN